MDSESKVLIGILILHILITFIFVSAYRSSYETKTITVDRTERVSGDSDKYLVFTDEGDVVEVTDSWSYLRFNSSEVYGSIKQDGTYTVGVAGWRVPLFSWYENIIDIEQVTESDTSRNKDAGT